MGGQRECERVPAELIVMTLLRRQGELTKAALVSLAERRSEYRVNLSRAMVSTALRRLEERGCVDSFLEETGRRPKKVYRLTVTGRIAQDIAYEEYYSTVLGMRLLLDFAAFEKGQTE